MEENVPQEKAGPVFPTTFLWMAAIVIVALISFLAGKNLSQPYNTQEVAVAQPTPTTSVLSAQDNSPQDVSTPTPVPETGFCQKTGPSQKKDYLKSYTIKEGDNINSIAQDQLGDVSRNTEITKLNQDQGQLMVGSVLYLPPDSIKSSSGNIAELSGKLVRKDNSYWQITYGTGPQDLGVLMPSYYFKDVPNAQDFKVGDCVTILLDNGVKAYSVRKSS